MQLLSFSFAYCNIFLLNALGICRWHSWNLVCNDFFRSSFSCRINTGPISGRLKYCDQFLVSWYEDTNSPPPPVPLPYLYTNMRLICYLVYNSVKLLYRNVIYPRLLIGTNKENRFVKVVVPISSDKESIPTVYRQTNY